MVLIVLVSIDRDVVGGMLLNYWLKISWLFVKP